MAEMGLAAGCREGVPPACGQCTDVRARAADLPRSAWAAGGQNPVSVDGRTWAQLDRDNADRNRNRTRLQLRSAVSRFPLCRADDGSVAVLALDAPQPA